MFIHSYISSYRTEEIKTFTKVPKIKSKIRTFRKETSVFAPWRQDDKYIINDCISHDIKFWKVPRFIKN